MPVGQQVHANGNMITNHNRNGNQNHSEQSYQTRRMAVKPLTCKFTFYSFFLQVNALQKKFLYHIHYYNNTMIFPFYYPVYSLTGPNL